MSEKQWIPFYLDLDPCESAIWTFELDKLLIKVWSRLESLWVLPKMACMRRLHPKGVPFLGFKRMCSRGDLTRQTRVGCVWTEMCVLQTNAGKLVLCCTVNYRVRWYSTTKFSLSIKRGNAFSLLAKTFFISCLTTALKALPLSHRSYFDIVIF